MLVVALETKIIWDDINGGHKSYKSVGSLVDAVAKTGYEDGDDNISGGGGGRGAELAKCGCARE